LAVVAFASILGLVYLRRTEPSSVAVKSPAGKDTPQATATNSPQPAASAPAQQDTVGATPTVASAGSSNTNDGGAALKPGAARFVRASNRSEGARAPKAEGTESVPDATQMAVPGEDKYIQAIASLSRAVDVGGEAIKPSLRAEYERNIAVIDRAISETRKQALRNPKDADTTGFLFSAYQQKIDLLSTVADQAQVAALGR
jgi:hypothetical protein